MYKITIKLMFESLKEENKSKEKLRSRSYELFINTLRLTMQMINLIVYVWFYE